MSDRFVLSPGDYIGEEFRAHMQAWCDDFFAPTTAPAPIKRVYRPRTKRNERRRDLGDLLDSISQTFGDLTLPAESMSCVRPETRIGLRKLGPHIPECDWQAQSEKDWKDFLCDEGERPKASLDDLSTMMFIGFPKVADELGRDEEPTKGAQEFIFAVRLAKLPPLVESLPGCAFYQCGAVYRYTKKSLMWTSFYVAVGDDGLIHAARERYCTNHSVTTKTGRERITHGYARKKLGFQVAQGQKWGSMDEIELTLARKFATAVKWWGKKSSMWSVSVSSRGDRVTFCIPPGEAKSYFKDRGRNALSPTGRLRPIFHVCREHERVLADGRVVVVKEHSKGMREFSWQGYKCAITAPTFHLVMSHAFNLPSLEEDDLPKEGLIDISKVGKMISDQELSPVRLR